MKSHFLHCLRPIGANTYINVLNYRLMKGRKWSKRKKDQGGNIPFYDDFGNFCSFTF